MNTPKLNNVNFEMISKLVKDLDYFRLNIIGTEVILTPEFFLTGFPPQINYTADQIMCLLNKIETNNVFIGYAEIDAGKRFSSYSGKLKEEFIHIRKEKAYQKTERRYISDGLVKPKVIETQTLGFILILSCYDAYRYSESLPKCSIDVILVPSYWRLLHQNLLKKCKKMARDKSCIVANIDYFHGIHLFKNGELVKQRFSEKSYFKCACCENEANDYCWNCCRELCEKHLHYFEHRKGLCSVCQYLLQLDSH